MSLRFDRDSEQREYVKETDDFVKMELSYAESMISGFAETGDHRDQLFVRSARRYLTSMDTARSIAAMFEQEDLSPEVRRVLAEFRKRYLDSFPLYIQNLTTALYQRDEARPLRTSPTAMSRRTFSPSAVTLEYPVTIRAAEAVNEDYHRRLLGFFGRDGRDGSLLDVDDDQASAAAPLVNLSGSTAATLQTRYGLWALLHAKEVRQARAGAMFGALAKYLRNSDCITLPRWSSQHVRTYAFAAHEHMHRVLWRVQLLRVFARDSYHELHAQDPQQISTPDVDYEQALGNREKRDQIFAEYSSFSREHEEDIGKPLTDLFEVTWLLYHAFWNFFRKHQIGLVPGGGSKARPMALDQTIEVLADVGALVIAGPAFAFAYRTVFKADTERELSYLRQGLAKHPPTALRTQLHIQLLRELRFTTVPELLEADFTDEWHSLASREPLLKDYSTFLLKEVYSLLAFAADIISETAGSARSYDLGKRSIEGQRLSTEVELQEYWLTMAKQVEREGAYTPDEVRHIDPADAVNAIWWKRVNEQGTPPRNRLAWRVALRNCHVQNRPTTR